MSVITIPKAKINKGGGVVILSLKEYQKLCERVVPTYYLKGKAAERADRLVEEGLKEYREGKTIIADPIKEALQTHGRRTKNRKN